MREFVCAFQTLFILLLCSTFSGCVEKIEDMEVPLTDQFEPSAIRFPYNGIVRADPIAHDKIEFVFEKVPESVGEDYLYKLYINDAEPGIELNPASLIEYGTNRYYFIQSGLSIKSLYKFKIRAFRKSDSAQSTLERVHTVQTFDNRVADFNGILNISPVQGTEGAAQPSLRIQWDKVPYFNWGNQTPFDPVRYEIYYSSVGPEDLWAPSPTRRGPIKVNITTEFFHPTETVVTDFLTPGTTFYFWVRAVHRAYKNFEDAGASYIPVDRENNKKFLSYKTAPLGGLPGFIESKNSFNLYPGLRADGFTKVRASWLPADGNFLKYKLIYLNQVPAASATDFSPEQIETILASNDPETGGFFDITKESLEFKDSKIEIPGLKTAETYYFKLFLCTIDSCPLSGVNVSSSYDLKSITVVPVLASFLGLNSIDNPVSPETMDEIKLNFDSPVLSVGWADKMNFYCEDGSNSYLLSSSANSTAPQASPCHGLFHLPFSNNSSSIQDLKDLTIKGVVIDKNNPQEYCFSATPVLDYTNLDGSTVSLTRTPRNQRCIVPELITPNLDQFSGLASCSPVISSNQKKLKFNFSTPQGGIFQKVVIFWKPKTATGFSFNQAISQFETEMKARKQNSNPDEDRKTCSGETYCFKSTSNVTQFTTDALSSGQYVAGALSYAKITIDNEDTYYWSQINTNPKECEIPLPFATFKGWVRVFAIGPKTSHTDGGGDNQFKIREAINHDGIPYELSLLSNHSSAPAVFRPPGQALVNTSGSTDTVNLNQALDIAKDPNGALGSTEGIISLAWEDVTLDDSSAQQIWNAEQNTINRNSENRKYGFKVYRSDNNRISWQELSLNAEGQSSVIHSVSSGGKRIVYFTDYSVVQPLQEDLGTQKARVYWYKVVPSFNGEELVYYNNLDKFHAGYAMVRVTLPPPNMALVHRWMANRSQCLEISKTPNLKENYSCEFTGLGAVPQSPPFMQNQTKLDLRGDLLIDRFELGCRFSRGPIAAQASLPSADFSTSSSVHGLAAGNSGCFKVDKSPDESGAPNPLPGLNFANDPELPGGANLTQYLLAGDCIGESRDASIPYRFCTDAEQNKGGIHQRTTSVIGFSNAADAGTNNHDPNLCNTHYLSKRFGIKHPADTSSFLAQDGSATATSPFEWVKTNLAQSQFGGVYHNTSVSGADTSPVIGVDADDKLIELGEADHWRYYPNPSCSINLAAIDPEDGQLIPRWVNLHDFRGQIEGVSLSSTVGQILNHPKLYKQGVLNVPTTSLDPALKMGRLLTTNRSDAPPLSGVSRKLAEEICGNYDIDVVVKAQTQQDVILSSHSKRLVRRREFLAANMWPETYSQTHTKVLEGVYMTSGESEDVGDKWPSSIYGSPSAYQGTNSCANSTGDAGSLSLYSQLPSRIKSNSAFFTGSDSTKLCVSRYGVQDLIGNLEEISSEVLFCSYSSMKLHYGKLKEFNASSWVSDGGRDLDLEDTGLEAPQVDLGLLSSNSGHRYLRKRTPPEGSSASEYFTIQNSLGGVNAAYTEDDPQNPKPTLFGPYMKSVGDTAGYCSMVDTDPNRRQIDLQSFQTLDFFSNTFSRVLNPNLFKEINPYDPLSAMNYRQGSGYFLDFGKTHLASSLLYENSLSFPWSWRRESSSLGYSAPSMSYGDSTWNYLNEQNYFFSHLLGLPLSCGGFEPSDPSLWNWWTACSKNSEDTFIVERETASINTLPSEMEAQTDNLNAQVIDNFYIGGSKITNDGLAKVHMSPGQVVVPTPSSVEPNGMSLITGVRLKSTYSESHPIGENGASSNQIPQTIIKIQQAQGQDDTLRLLETDKVDTITENILDESNFEPGSTVYYWDARWATPRNQNLNFYQGGHLNQGHNGRFSLHVGNKGTPSTNGVRCGVLIHEGD